MMMVKAMLIEVLGVNELMLISFNNLTFSSVINEALVDISVINLSLAYLNISIISFLMKGSPPVIFRCLKPCNTNSSIT